MSTAWQAQASKTREEKVQSLQKSDSARHAPRTRPARSMQSTCGSTPSPPLQATATSRSSTSPQSTATTQQSHGHAPLKILDKKQITCWYFLYDRCKFGDSCIHAHPSWPAVQQQQRQQQQMQAMYMQQQQQQMQAMYMQQQQQQMQQSYANAPITPSPWQAPGSMPNPWSPHARPSPQSLPASRSFSPPAPIARPFRQTPTPIARPAPMPKAHDQDDHAFDDDGHHVRHMLGFLDKDLRALTFS